MSAGTASQDSTNTVPLSGSDDEHARAPEQARSDATAAASFKDIGWRRRFAVEDRKIALWLGRVERTRFNAMRYRMGLPRTIDACDVSLYC